MGNLQALEGFRQFTSIVERRGNHKRTAATQQHSLESFFETHALGMMASFSDVIDNPNEPLLEKKRCLCAVEQMIDIGRENMAIALPQVS